MSEFKGAIGRTPANAEPHGGEVFGDKQARFINVCSPATRWVLDVLNEARRVASTSPSGPVRV